MPTMFVVGEDCVFGVEGGPGGHGGPGDGGDRNGGSRIKCVLLF